jgi:hypothetical protein
MRRGGEGAKYHLSPSGERETSARLSCQGEGFSPVCRDTPACFWSVWGVRNFFPEETNPFPQAWRRHGDSFSYCFGGCLTVHGFHMGLQSRNFVPVFAAFIYHNRDNSTCVLEYKGVFVVSFPCI